MKDILVRYSELGLKSPPVRRLMEKRLARQIKIALEKEGFTDFQITIHKHWGRLIVSSKIDHPTLQEENDYLLKLVYCISDVIGVKSVSPVFRTKADLETLKDDSLAFVSKRIKEGQSFVVRARRVGKHTFTSLELERIIGEVIFDNLAEIMNLSVDLKNHDYKLTLEVRDNEAFLFDQIIPGYGGLPEGFQGILGSILRGSLEDAVAGFLLCKRGAIALPILFEKTKEDEFETNKKQLEKQLLKYHTFITTTKLRFFTVDFDSIIKNIGYERLTCSICDKICIGITEKILVNYTQNGITLGNDPDAILDRNPEKNLTDVFIPIYYPLIAITIDDTNHPFQKGFESAFCLKSCPGNKNQKNKKIKPLSKAELLEIVASANFSQSTIP